VLSSTVFSQDANTPIKKDHGFKVLSLFGFRYAVCKYCPGEFWPDQKTADHTLLIYSTEQSTDEALAKLTKRVWNNVYI
jgi:hypothetical protein